VAFRIEEIDILPKRAGITKSDIVPIVEPGGNSQAKATHSHAAVARA
jgi:hypothetical protein